MHKSGKYPEAIERYEAALASAAQDGSPEGQALQVACRLNLAACYLQTEQFGLCVSRCSEVIAGDSRNLKARYRRSQAHRRLGNLHAAWQDGSVAAEVEPADETVAGFLEQLRAEGADSAEPTVEPEPAAVGFERDTLLGMGVKQLRGLLYENGSDTSGCTSKEDMIDKLLALEPGSKPVASNPVPPASGGIDPQQMEFARQQMRQNPDAVKQAAKRMENMTDAELEAMNAQMPAGQRVSKEQARMMSGMMANMSPEQLDSYTQMAQQMGGGADQAKAMAAMQENPEMMKQAANAMKGMDKEQLSKMAEASGMAGMTPEMAAMAGEMMQNMKPEDMARMQKMAAEMQKGGSGGQPDMAAMSKMMENPEMVESMTNMMQNISPEMAAKMGLSPEQAEKMSESMKGMDKATLQKVMKWGLKAQGAWQTVKTKRFWLQALGVLLIALVIGHLTNTF